MHSDSNDSAWNYFRHGISCNISIKVIELESSRTYFQLRNASGGKIYKHNREETS